MEYRLFEQRAGYIAYPNDDDMFMLEHDSSQKSEILDTPGKIATWLDRVFSQSGSEQFEEVGFALLRTDKGSEQSYQMLFRSEFIKDTDKEPFRVVGFDVTPDRSMGIALSGRHGDRRITCRAG